MALSSNWLGQHAFNVQTGVRISLELPCGELPKWSYWGGLENHLSVRARGFESLTLRHRGKLGERLKPAAC